MDQYDFVAGTRKLAGAAPGSYPNSPEAGTLPGGGKLCCSSSFPLPESHTRMGTAPAPSVPVPRKVRPTLPGEISLRG